MNLTCQAVAEMLKMESDRFIGHHIEMLIKPSPFMAWLPKSSCKPLTKSEFAAIEIDELEQRIKDAQAVLKGEARVVYEDDEEW